MANYITVDGGTTNTRLYLVKDRCVVDTVKLNVGAGNGKEALTEAIRAAIKALLSQNSMTEQDITRVLASGMITSEYGLCALPHLTVPAGLDELHGAMHEVVLKEITSIPFVFLRGVKTDCADAQSADMMRGEETELFGILQPTDRDSLYVLPGSHSKLITVDRMGKIVGFSTMMTGEMAAALSQHTILKDAVTLSGAELDIENLSKGYEDCKQHGINHTLFRVRVMKNLFGADPAARYSYFIGAVLQAEIDAIIKSPSECVVLGGQKQLRLAMAELLAQYSQKEIVTLTDEEVGASVVKGTISIYEKGE